MPFFEDKKLHMPVRVCDLVAEKGQAHNEIHYKVANSTGNMNGWGQKWPMKTEEIIPND